MTQFAQSFGFDLADPFASDAELPALARDVLAGKLTKPQDIKQAIKQWRPDHLRA